VLERRWPFDSGMKTFVKPLLAWFRKSARPMPWRGINDPYAIWVSEIMLQQTRVETVIPYFQNWMMRFPTIEVLAMASEQDVLSLWEGLGYYSRARNLHRAARKVVENHGGELPRDLDLLRCLPGVGVYTAAAIASLAFGMDIAAVDGNIRRVISRLFDVTEVADSPAGKKKLQSLADEHLPEGRAGDYNQALMDLGATICLPRKPDCRNCPVAKFCLALANGTQEERPVMKPKPEVPHVTVTAAVIQREDEVLLAQRPSNGLLGGMWEFPGGKQEPGESLSACLEREIREELGVGIQVGVEIGVFRHAYTHFRVTLHAFICSLDGNMPRAIEVQDVRWVELGELEKYPMGKIDRQIAKILITNVTSQL
jgi:A/G-specific adenine glycosylase